MKNWILNVVSIIFIIVIFSIFLPESRVGKYAKSILSVFILIITISPIIKKDFSRIEEEVVFNEDYLIQEDYLYYINDYKVNLIKEKCNKLLIELDITNAVLDVEYNINDAYNVEIKKVNINLSESVINSVKPHKYIIDEIKNEISKQVGISKELIIVYE